MNAEFSRTLSLLRQEKGVSQRTAAGVLGISQALLSHYENGIREPGLTFVVKACDYYGVSADYLLGRTLTRDGTTIGTEELYDISDEKDNSMRGSVLALLSKKLLVNSVGMLFDLLGKTGSREAIRAASNYLSTAVYKVFRRLYQANPSNNPDFFSVPARQFAAGLPEADMACSEVELCEALAGQGLAQLHLAARHVSLGQAGGELPGRDGEKVRVVGRVGLIQAAEHLIDSGGQVVGGGADGLPAAGLAQQVEEHAHRVHQQFFGQQGQHRPPHGVVLLIADVIELLGADGGAVPGEGPAQQVVGGHPVVVAGLDHEGQARLPDAVFVVGQQGLGDTQDSGGGALADPFFLPQKGQGAGKFCVQISHLKRKSIHLV